MSENLKIKEKSELKSLKDIKSIDELDFSKIELVRGKTPSDINDKCLKICKDYLSGNWPQQTIDTIEVRRITGGMVNQLYYCGIKEPDNNKNVPQEVAIKFYGKNTLEMFENSRMRDVVIALLLSEKKIGPHIYGLFDEGQIQKYYQHRQFKEEEQKCPQIREQVFQTLAKIHSLEVPIEKDPNRLSAIMLNFYTRAFEGFPISEEIEIYCISLKNYDFKSEMDYVLSAVQTAESPVVFTHNDFRSSNLMITEPNDELIVCDYDVSGYGYRGFDFVSLSREWGRKQFDRTPVRGIPFKDEEFRPLIEIYIEKCVKIHGKRYSQNEINSVKHILKEIKIFLLFSSFLCVVDFLKNDESDDTYSFSRKLVMEMTEKNMEDYISLKKALKDQNIIL